MTLNRSTGAVHSSRAPLAASVLAIAALLASGPAAFAQTTVPQPGTQGLDRVGAVSRSHGYPLWYQDKTGLVLEFCDNTSQAELDGGWCVLLPPDIPGGTGPEVFPTKFADEHFYWTATNVGPTPIGATGQNAVATLVLAIEGAFAQGPVVAGDQVVFARLRIKLVPVPFDGTYTVYTPFGKFDFPDQVAGDKIFFTQDIGLAPGDFTQVLHGSIGPFLLPSATPGGAELPPIPLLQPDSGLDPFYTSALGVTPYPANGRKYIADPARLGPITGSPMPDYTVSDGTTRNANIFRIEGPNGFLYESTLFSVAGRIYEGPIAGKLSVDRAFYARANGNRVINVFASAAPNQQARIPAGPTPSVIPSNLSYFTAPCTPTLDPVSGEPGPPYSAPTTNAMAYQMLAAEGRTSTYYVQTPYSSRMPLEICVQSNGVTPDGQTVMQYTPAPLNDQVTVTSVLYDPDQRTLSVKAESSDLGNFVGAVPSLSLEGFGALTSGQITVDQVIAPPADVTVTSSRGGRDTAQVKTGFASATAPPLPTAVNDTASTAEDTPVDVMVVANDTGIVSGSTVRVPLPGTPGWPVMGSIALSADGLTVRYAPNPNAFGTDSFTYSVVLPDQTVTNVAVVSIAIAPMNDAPVAVNDLGIQGLRLATTQANLLANDGDPDGSIDLATGMAGVDIVDSPVLVSLGLRPGYRQGGTISITPGAATQGQYAFQYFAVDSAGVRSPAVATVVVTVAAIESIVPAKTLYTQNKARWVITGTVTPNVAQTMVLTYTDGTYKVNGQCGPVNNAAGVELARVIVDPTNTYTWDTILTSTTGVKNPSNTLGNSTGFWCSPPRSVRIASTLTNGNATQAIQLK